MKGPSRITVFFSGLAALYACFLWPLLRAPQRAPFILPPLSSHHGLISLFYAHALAHFFGPSIRSLVLGNLMVLVVIGVVLFRMGWLLCRGHRRLFGAGATVVFFLLSPSVLSSVPRFAAPFFLGIPLALLLMMWFWLSMENWSTFMKSLVLAWAWAAFLWLSVPLACAIALALVPWIIFSRRPLSSLGIGLVMIGLGGAVFAFSWASACGWSHHWNLIGLPLQLGIVAVHQAAQNLFLLLQVKGSWRLVWGRILYYLVEISPFWFAAGMWHLSARASKVVAECRAKTVDYMALLSVILVGADILQPTVILEVPFRYPLCVLALWAPLLGRELSRLPKLNNEEGMSRIDQLKIILAGSTLVYFVVRDWMIFRS